MTLPSYAVTFACYNQVEYTRQCVDSLVRHGFDLSRLVVVDNGSNDETRSYLQTLSALRIFNRENLGCGVAWNQGALALQADWTVVMNNEVVVSAGWLEHLLGVAQARGWRLASPALIDRSLDYDFEAFSRDASLRMSEVVRESGRHAVCMAIHKSVWQQVGYFQPVPKLWGYEDTMFFNEVEDAGIPTGITGASWLHHFGSITLSALKRERGLSQKEGLSARDSYRLLGQSFLERKWRKFCRTRLAKQWRRDELANYGMTLHGERENGQFRWR